MSKLFVTRERSVRASNSWVLLYLVKYNVKKENIKTCMQALNIDCGTFKHHKFLVKFSQSFLEKMAQSKVAQNTNGTVLLRCQRFQIQLTEGSIYVYLLRLIKSGLCQFLLKSRSQERLHIMRYMRIFENICDKNHMPVNQ